MDTGNDADGTNRQLKWFWVVFEVMTCMLQDVLWKEIRPDRLADAVMNSKPLKKRFKKLNALDKIIKAKDSQKPYEDFDISLLYVCLRNTCPKIKPKKGWEQKPKDSDTTIGDDVERIRHFRNDLVHASKVFMSAMESEENWATAVDIGRRLGEYVGRNVNYEEEIKRCQNNSITPAMKTEVTEKLERLENEVCLLKLKVTESWKLRSEASSQAERKRQNLSILQHHIVLILNETSNSIREKSKKSKIKKVLRRFKKHDDVLNQLTETPEFQDLLNNLTGKILMCAKEKKNEHKIFAIYLKFLCEWERKYSCSIICSPGCISLAVNFLSIAEMDLFLSDFENGNISLDLQEVLLYPPLLSLFDLQEGDLDFRITILEEDQDEKSEENLFNERRNFQENKNWNSLDKFLHIDCKAFLRALLKHIQEEDLGIATSKESQRTKSRKDTAREKKEVENLALEECFSIFRSGVYKDFISEPKLGWESREFPRGNQTNVADDILRLFFYWEEVRSKKDMKISKAKMADVVFVLQEIAERMARIYGDLGVDLQNKVAALTDDASISEELKKTDETSVKDFGEKEDMRKYKEFFENQDLEDTNDLISFKETLQDLRHKTFRACNAELLQNYMMPMKQALEHVKRQDLEIKLYGSAERALIWIQETEKLLEVEAIEKLKGFDALRSEMDGLLRYVSSVMDQVPSEMESIKKKLRAVYSKVKLFNECISNKEERITIDIDSRGTILSSPIQGLSLQMWDNNDRNEHMPNLDRSLFQTSVTEVFRFTLQGKPYTVHSKNEDVILVRIQMINLKKPNGRQWLSKVCHRDIWTTIETQTQDDWIFFGIEALESFFIIESAEEMPMTIDPKGGVYMHVSDPKAQIEIPKDATVERQIANVSVVLMETPSFLGFTMISKIVRTSAHFLKPVTVHFPETIQSTDSNLASFHFDIIHEKLTIDFTHTIKQEGGCFIALVSEFSETGIVAVPKSYSQQSGSFILPSHEYKQNRKMEFKCKSLTYVSKEREDFAQLWCEVVLVDNIDERRTMMKIKNSEFMELKESNDFFLKEDDRIRVNVTGLFNNSKQKLYNIIRFNVSTDNHIILPLEKTGREINSKISYEKCIGKDKYLWQMSVNIEIIKTAAVKSLQRQRTREGFALEEFKSFLHHYELGNLIETFIKNDITGLKVFLGLSEEDLKELSLSLGHRRSCLAAIKDYRERHGK